MKKTTSKLFALITSALAITSGSLSAATANANVTLSVGAESAQLTVSETLAFSSLTAYETLTADTWTSNGQATVTSIFPGSYENGQNVVMAFGTTDGSGNPTLVGVTNADTISFQFYYAPVGSWTSKALVVNNAKIITTASATEDTATCLLDALLPNGTLIQSADTYNHTATLTSTTGA